MPEQAQISAAESPAAGSVHLRFDAPGATSFQVWHKGPGGAQFAQVDEVLRPGPGQPAEYFKSGLAGGSHQYEIVGGNSRGEGPASEPVAVSVAAAAAA